MPNTADLDPIVHAAPRLRVMVALQELPDGHEVSFQRLQELLEMTPGNLSSQLRKLEDSGYVTIRKTFERRRPATYLALSAEGASALRTYISNICHLLGVPSEERIEERS